MLYYVGSIPYDSNYLEHYGVKGMKWGVRRYQNKDGSYTEEGRNRAYALRTRKDVDKIYNSFSKKDKYFIGDDDPTLTEFLSREMTGEFVIKRFLAKHKGIPVAFLDVLKGYDNSADIAIGTHADYRGKGYASKVAKEGVKWIDEHLSEFSEVRWSAYKENTASINLAKKNGFSYEDEDEDFVTYSKKK